MEGPQINFNLKFYNKVSVSLGPYEMMKLTIFKFCFYFCLQYALASTLYDFDLSFLRIILKSTFYGLLQGIIFYNCKILILKRSLYSPFLPLFVHSVKLFIVTPPYMWYPVFAPF